MSRPYNSNAYLGVLANPFVQVVATPVMDTNIFASGDVLFTGLELANCVPIAGGYSKLVSLDVVDSDDAKVAMDLYLTQESTAFGTVNAAPNISDANLLAAIAQGTVLAIGSIYKDLGGIAVAGLDNINRIVKAKAGSKSLYLHGITGGTPTHTASGLRFKFNFQHAG